MTFKQKLMTNEQKKKKKKKQVLETWTTLKDKITKLITNQPTELLTQINKLEQEINQIKHNNPSWNDEYKLDNTPKGEIAKLAVRKSILQEKLAYQQGWKQDKEGQEKQLTIMTEKWNISEKKLEEVRELVSEGQIKKLARMIKEGKI